MSQNIHLSPGSPEAISLGSAVFVTITDITPCSLVLKIDDDHIQQIEFLYPVEISKARTKIARKSLRIKVTVPIAPFLANGGYDLDPFPVVISKSHQPYSWALPYFDLAKQPRAETGPPERWLSEIYKHFANAREMKIKRTNLVSLDFRTALLYLKQTALELMEQFAGR